MYKQLIKKKKKKIKVSNNTNHNAKGKMFDILKGYNFLFIFWAIIQVQ